MKTISQSQLLDLIKSTKGAAIVGILAETDAKARKTGNPFGKIFKTVRAVGFCGADYGNAVLNEGLREEKQIDFVPDSLPWGEWLVAGKVITHKGELYLRLQTTASQRSRQPAKVLGYRAENGRFLSFEQVKPFLPEKRESEKQIEAGIDTGKTVMVRTYKFNSLKVIRYAGQSYRLAPSTDEIKQKYNTLPVVAQEVAA